MNRHARAQERPSFSKADLPPTLVRLIGRWYFGTAACAALFAAGVHATLPPTLLPAGRWPLTAALVIYAALNLWSLRSSADDRFRSDPALFLAALGAIALSGAAAVLSQDGLRHTALAFGGLVTCMLCAVASLRWGVALAVLAGAQVAALAWAQGNGLLPAGTTGTPAWLAMLWHTLVIACGVAGGALLARVLDHYVHAAAEREDRFRGLLGIAANRYWELGADLRFTHIVDARSGAQDESARDWLGRTPWEIPDYGLDSGRLDAHRADLESRRPFDALLATRPGPDRRLRSVSLSGEPRFDASGGFVGYWGVERDMTREAAARRAVAASETRYRELFGRSPSPIVLHRGAAVFDANDAAARMFGLERAGALIGLDLLTLFAEGPSRERARLRMAELARLGPGQGLPVAEFQLVSVDGRRVTAQGTAVRVDTETGPATLSIFFDITARVAAEAALKRSQEMLSHLFASSPEGITLTDMGTGRFTFVNDGFLRRTGFKREDVIGKTSLELGMWPDEQQRLRMVETIRRDGAVYGFPVESSGRDGKRRWLELSVARFEMEGKPYLVTNSRDVTVNEQSRLEVEAILNTVSLAIAFVRDDRIVRINARHEAMFGWSTEDYAGTDALAALWPDEREVLGIRRKAAQRLRMGESFETETRMRRRDGSLFWCRLRAQAVDPRHPRAGGTIWTAEDVTARREFEETLAAARDAAEAANRAKSAFLANTSHEIRTPLNGLLGLARMAMAPDVGEARRQQYLGQIHDSTQTLAGIISDILDLSKIEAGKIELENVPFALRETLVSVHRAYQPLAEAKGLLLTLSLDDSLPASVAGDPLRVRQVLSNFVNNAVKFTERGQVRIAGGIGLLGLVRLEVHDSGPGIDATTQARLFTPFSQADESTTRRFGGTGLGLSICRELAHLMGGEVGVTSQPGEGSVFWAELPLPARSPAVAAEDAAPGAIDALQGAHVLMAEDNAVNMMIAVAMLEQWGIEVEQAVDGQLALDAVARADRRGRPFDAVLMDVHMPVLSGHAAVRELRRTHDAQRLPVIALTAAALVSEREEALAAGMNDFLTKPIDAGRLRRTLARHIRRAAHV